MRCTMCGKEIENGAISALGEKDFCSDICHLRFWKNEMPNLGGVFITDESLAILEKLEGRQRKEFYSKIVMNVMDNSESTPLMMRIKQGADDGSFTN